MTKLCRSIAASGFNRVAQLAAGAEMSEIRIEKSGMSLDEVRQLFGTQQEMIATCRPDGLDADQQTAYLQAAIEVGAAWVDVEIEATDDYRENIIKTARKHGCKVIVSYHNYDETPSFPELQQIADFAHSAGADLVKIACMCNRSEDVLNLLNLYKSSYPVLSIGMGGLGAVTRIAAITFDAPFTFVSIPGEPKTALGQLDEQEMANIRAQIK